MSELTLQLSHSSNSILTIGLRNPSTSLIESIRVRRRPPFFIILHEFWRAREREEVEQEKGGKLLSIGMHSKAKVQHKNQGREYSQQRDV
jgi:hypothetical protein